MFRYPGFLQIAHRTAMSIIAFALIVAGLSQVRQSISPLSELRERLADVRAGRAPRLEGTYPSEVQPLVSDLNALLDNREQVVKRAQAQAGDLAHGLKTPLAVLSQEAAQARAEGHLALADGIQQQIDRMRRQMDFHLAHARAAASGARIGTCATAKEATDALVRTLQRLYADRALVFEVQVPSDHVVQTERQDLDEMLGNLLDNACKWAKSRVTVRSKVGADGRIVISIEDDGGGIDPSLRERVLQRGVRADQAAPGSGLGLAIVRDLAEVYSGGISLDSSSLGGVKANLQLPKA
jgi:signal transduction histidine kinase